MILLIMEKKVVGRILMRKHNIFYNNQHSYLTSANYRYIMYLVQIKDA